MSQPNDRPSIPMKGQPASARPPMASPSPLTVSSNGGLPASRRRNVFAALRRPNSQRWFRNPSIIALAVIAGLAVVITFASLITGNTAIPDVGEAGDTTVAAVSPVDSVADPADNTNPSPGVSTTSLLPTGVADLEALAISSVVSIDIYSDSELCSGGSGSVVLDGMYVLTNLHVVEDDAEYDCYIDEIVVRYLDRVDEDPVAGFIAKVVATDRASDLAVLELTRQSGVTKQLIPVTVSSGASVNEDLFIAGFPAIGGNSITFSRGIVSGFLQESGVRWIKTDAQISGGNSGGPAFNARGELVGVPTRASASSSGDIVDCRIVEDTNGDGRINDRDACVPIGGSFSLLSPASAAESILKKVTP